MSLENDENNDKVDLEINSYNGRIENLNKMNYKLLDAYLRQSISDEEYTNKKKEIEMELIELKNTLKIIEGEKMISRPSLEEKIKQYKTLIKENLNYSLGDMSDSLVNLLVDKVVVNNDHYEWYLKLSNDILNVEDLYNKKEKENILIANLAITSDDVITYSKYDEELKRVKITEPLIVNIYM